MRLLDLRLKAVGPFTDRVLDLSAGSEGLHLVHGPNEAGKSSALRAVRALFFGFSARTTDGFVHEYTQLRVGGKLRRRDGTEIVAFRRKGNKKTLFDAAEQQLGDDALAPFLGGVSESLFDLLFGLDHEALVQGGADLLAGRGDVGQSLFAAAPGGAHMRKVLVELDAEAAELFKARGHNQRINAALRAHEGERKKVSEAALAGSTWTQARDDREAAGRDFRTVKGQLTDLDRDLRRLERLKRTMPGVARLRGLRQERAIQPSVVVLAEGFTADRVDTQRRLDDERQKVLTYQRDLGAIGDALAAITRPEALLASATGIDELHQRLGGHRKALADVPMLEGLLKGCDDQARALAAAIEPDTAPTTLASRRPTTAARARVQEVGQQHGALQQAAKQATEQVQTLKDETQVAEAAEADRPAVRDPAALRAVVQEATQHGDLDALLAAAAKANKDEATKADAQLAALGRWQGTLAEVAGLAVPITETVDRFARDATKLQKRRDKAEDRSKELAIDRAEIDSRLHALRQAGDVPTEVVLATERDVRDQQWQLLRPVVLGDAPPAAGAEAAANDFEGAVRRADDVGDRLRREADRVAQLASLLAEEGKLTATAAALAGELETLAADEARHAEQWRAEWAAAAVDPLPPAEMRAWLTRHEKLVTTVERLQATEDEVGRLTTVLTTQRAALAAALKDVGESAPATPGLAATRRHAEATATRIEGEVRARSDATRAMDSLRVRLKVALNASEKADQALKSWTEAWRAATRTLELGEDATPQVAAAVLDTLEQLHQSLDKAEGFRKRLSGIRRDAGRFEDDVKALVAVAGPDLHAIEASTVVVQLRDKLADARDDVVRQAELGKKKQVAEDGLVVAKGMVERLEGHMVALCRQAGTTDPAALPGIEALSDHRRGVDRDLADVERQLVEQGDGASLEQIIAAAEGADADGLPGQLAELSRQHAEVADRGAKLNQAIGAAQTKLDTMSGGADAADAAAAAQGHLADVRAGVERYLRVRLAADVLRAEVERWRAAQEGPVVARASELFAALTLGSFAKLRTTFGEDDLPVLVGERPNGKVVGVAGMSTGTRDQLYLALRLASLERQMDAQEPLPLLVDDILVDFDDQRAAAALRLLAELSSRTQVLLFTHHERVVELASALPANVCTIHRLGAAAVT